MLQHSVAAVLKQSFQKCMVQEVIISTVIAAWSAEMNVLVWNVGWNCCWDLVTVWFWANLSEQPILRVQGSCLRCSLALWSRWHSLLCCDSPENKQSLGDPFFNLAVERQTLFLNNFFLSEYFDKLCFTKFLLWNWINYLSYFPPSFVQETAIMADKTLWWLRFSFSPDGKSPECLKWISG